MTPPARSVFIATRSPKRPPRASREAASLGARTSGLRKLRPSRKRLRRNIFDLFSRHASAGWHPSTLSAWCKIGGTPAFAGVTDCEQAVAEQVAARDI